MCITVWILIACDYTHQMSVNEVNFFQHDLNMNCIFCIISYLTQYMRVNVIILMCVSQV